jgi:glutathione S-transferase
MITLYSYPPLFGVADNNGYGLKIFAFLRLAGLPFVHEHVFDAAAAPRGQLPYIDDDGELVGDSGSIIAYLTDKYDLTLDASLDAAGHGQNLLINRLLDDLYWVMSYSRWQDERYFPAFQAAFLREHPGLTAEALATARAFNAQRYHFQGIGRYTPEAAYARGLADLAVLNGLVSPGPYVHGAAAGSVDAAIYGFIANIYFYDIDTPLKQMLVTRPNLVRHCLAIHEAVAP